MYLELYTFSFPFRFGMGIEFREGSLLISSKNTHVAKKGKNIVKIYSNEQVCQVTGNGIIK